MILLLGITYITYISYAVMINTGTFGTVLDQVAAQAPDQLDTLYALANQIANLKVADIGMGFVERAFAVIFHIGASIIVFYAFKDKGKFWLYPLAIMLHTAMDFIVGLTIVKVIHLSIWLQEGILGAFGILTFCGAYFLLYKKDTDEATDKID